LLYIYRNRLDFFVIMVSIPDLISEVRRGGQALHVHTSTATPPNSAIPLRVDVRGGLADTVQIQ
jgi:hypothetical protein